METDDGIRATDWDRYYSSIPATARVTRRITARKLCRHLAEFSRDIPRPSVVEFGGANSWFVEYVRAALDPSRYASLDLNEKGLSLFDARFADDETVFGIRADALALTPEQRRDPFDIVFSIGMIEHFTVEDTARCIRSHFEMCKPGGIVLITFPVPTLPYRAVRGASEKLGQWYYYDERPLSFEEVCGVCDPFGEKLHQSINWWIGLTQGYVVYRRA